MEIILLAVSIIIILSFKIVYDQKIKIKRLREWIKEHYGKCPGKSQYDWEKIAYYWSEFDYSIPNDEKIDDVTWNDLEMNNIFCRINNCNSFAGEQVLYSTLHCLKKINSSRELLGNKISFFTS